MTKKLQYREPINKEMSRWKDIVSEDPINDFNWNVTNAQAIKSGKEFRVICDGTVLFGVEE